MAYAKLRYELERAGIRHRTIRGCPYPEMTRAEQVREFMLSDREVLVFVDGNVTVDVAGVEVLADAARVWKGVALPEATPEWAYALEFCAIHRDTVSAMLAAETRRYGNSAVEMTFNAERMKATPLASPWERDGAPLVRGEWLTESEAFLVRAVRTGAFPNRVVTGAKMARRTIQTSVVNDGPPGDEPGAKFALCIPSFGALDVDQTNRVDELQKAGMMVVRIHDCPWIDVSRSWLAETALEAGRGVFFLDHDVIFHPNDVLRLCEQALDRDAVVAGAYCMRSSGKNVIGAFDVPPGPIDFFKMGSTLPAHYSGLGFASIPESVLREMPLPVGSLHHMMTTRRLRSWFALDCSTNFYAGEDVSFCKRVHDLSIHTVENDGEVEWIPTASGRKNCRIFIDTRVRLAHRGSYDYGIEDAGCVVPRCDELRTVMTPDRASARAMLIDAMADVPVDARLDMIEGYSEPGARSQKPETPDYEAI